MLDADNRLSDATRRFRALYREQEISKRYRGGGTCSSLGAPTRAARCLWQLKAVRPLEWLTIPLAFLYANLANTRPSHPMHIRGADSSGLSPSRGQHHRFFTDREMAYDSIRDLRVLLFPPLLVIFFFGGFGLPVWALLAWGVSTNVAWLFIATGVAYFLNYEVLHLAYHVPPGHWLGRVPGVQRLKWLHQAHHDTARMTRINFNISYPVGDWLSARFRAGNRNRNR